MSGQYQVADITALKAVTPGEGKYRFVASKGHVKYVCTASTNTGNNEWIVTPTGGGSFRWFSTGTIFGTSFPSGAVTLPITYIQVNISSGDPIPERLFTNAGGESTVWSTTLL